MATEVETRYCGYAECGQALDYDGRGRPPEYCQDRRWADGRTCRQLAAAQRAAERAAGLEAPLEAFRAAEQRSAQRPLTLANSAVASRGRVAVDGPTVCASKSTWAIHDAVLSPLRTDRRRVDPQPAHARVVSVAYAPEALRCPAHPPPLGR